MPVFFKVEPDLTSRVCVSGALHHFLILVLSRQFFRSFLFLFQVKPLYSAPGSIFGSQKRTFAPRAPRLFSSYRRFLDEDKWGRIAALRLGTGDS